MYTLVISLVSFLIPVYLTSLTLTICISNSIPHTSFRSLQEPLMGKFFTLLHLPASSFISQHGQFLRQSSYTPTSSQTMLHLAWCITFHMLLNINLSIALPPKIGQGAYLSCSL
jgi:hypothetical protein